MVEKKWTGQFNFLLSGRETVLKLIYHICKNLIWGNKVGKNTLLTRVPTLILQNHGYIIPDVKW